MKPTWTSDCGMVELYRGDCLAILPTLADSSIDLVASDPPYFKVKGEDWDNQWDTADSFLQWLGVVVEQWQRITKPNGSLYAFASPKMAARVELKIAESMHVLNSIRWKKPAYSTKAEMFDKSTCRRFLTPSEQIIFAEQYNADNAAKGEAGYGAKCDELRGFVFEPLRAYLEGERIRADVSKPLINAEWCRFKGVNSTSQTQKWFTQSCFNPPTEEAYEFLRGVLCKHGGGDYLRREYEDLRREYEDLRREYEDLRRPFSVSADVPFSDVWTFPTVAAYPDKHPCEKPLKMMEHIVNVSSREGATVLDSFMGYGTTGLAAIRLGRRFIGMEMGADNFKVARERIEAELNRYPLFENEIVEVQKGLAI